MAYNSVSGRVLMSMLAFLIYISLYALLYSSVLKDDFLHASIKFEPNYENSIFLTKEIVGEYSYMEGTFWIEEGVEDTPESPYFYSNLESVYWHVSEITDTSLTVSVRIADKENNSAPDMWADCTFQLIEVNRLVAPHVYYERPDHFSCLRTSPPDESRSSYHEIPVTSKQAEMIHEIIDPRLTIEEGIFYRMLYFSAVTATTLGYGDIIPVSNRARLAVAIESVLGLVLMGLLVYWISNINSKERG